MTKHRTLAEAYAANAADCATTGHSWVAISPNGPRTHCSWCGAHRTPAAAIIEQFQAGGPVPAHFEELFHGENHTNR